MGSKRIRGQEALVQVSLDGELQVGTFFKVRDFRVSERGDLVEESYLGELADDLDYQHHGFDGSFTLDNEDAGTIAFLADIVSREQAAEEHPDIVITVTYIYRDPGLDPVTESYSDCVMRRSEQTIGGRKEYVQSSFEFKARTMQVLVG